MSDVDQPAPPAGEEIHLPGPTLIPLLSAVGITLVVIGTTLTPAFIVIGLIIFLATTVRWIRDTRHDLSELPEEPH